MKPASKWKLIAKALRSGSEDNGADHISAHRAEDEVKSRNKNIKVIAESVNSPICRRKTKTMLIKCFACKFQHLLHILKSLRSLIMGKKI